MSIVAILTDPAKGGTFLTWSLHFLAGHTQYFSVKKNIWTDLVDNPLTDKNAHGFTPNQPLSYTEFQSYTDKLLNCQTPNFHTVYFHNFLEYPYSADYLETKKAIDEIVTISDKKIVLTNQLKNSLYEISFYNRSSSNSFKDPSIQNLSDQEKLNDFVEYFFKDSLAQWQELGLTNSWDQREFLALNYRHRADSISPLIDLSTPHYSIDCLEWFNTADSLVLDLFDYLEVKIDNGRFAQWNEMYQAWRKIHYSRLNFLWCFDKIIDYIIHGKYMDLQRFNLDICQEAVIQHELIYKHNLNLKTWQLEKFTNTLQLHKLLESNIHDLSKHQL